MEHQDEAECIVFMSLCQRTAILSVDGAPEQTICMSQLQRHDSVLSARRLASIQVIPCVYVGSYQTGASPSQSINVHQWVHRLEQCGMKRSEGRDIVGGIEMGFIQYSCSIRAFVAC